MLLWGRPIENGFECDHLIKFPVNQACGWADIRSRPAIGRDSESNQNHPIEGGLAGRY
jgi:hypothetical protein